MNDASTELNELWELSGEGDAEWWPHAFVVRTVDERGDVYWQYIDRDMLHQHALTIVRDAVEGWLVGQGWVCIRYRTNNRYELKKRPQQNTGPSNTPSPMPYATQWSRRRNEQEGTKRNREKTAS